tara:strand:- start:409 stop:567 length:159 start_codon:yes stop_codon:yes gene_type:complete
MEKVMSNIKSQINSPDDHLTNKDIEEAIQRAIDTEIKRKSKVKNTYKHYKTK